MSRELYLPPGSRWYDVSRLLTEGIWAESEVGVVTMDTPLDLVPLHVRGGLVTPLQQPAATRALYSGMLLKEITVALRHAAINAQNHAAPHLFS